ncbi:MAG: ABC transporter substrate-binding protein [Pseudomonadales bacterium]|nr:ABC transporter substrate-binding protein [Pseudomonadales bacterium]
MSDPLIGKTLKESYVIERALADGGMGMVYLAKQISLDRNVVLKVLRPNFYDKAFIDLFLREARINSQINHPNVVSVVDFGEADDNVVFLAMEYLKGQVLGDIVAEGGAFNLARIVWLMEQICNGIYAAHQLNIVHRDLKPNNVMVAELSGDTTVAKVLDFGISKPLDEKDLEHTQMGMVMGTPGYLAPEQIEGGELDARADIYALGALMYFVATGERPFNGVSREIIMRQQLSGETPTLTKENCRHEDCLNLNPVIQKAMAVDKRLRYKDVKSLWQDILEHAQAHQKLQRGDTEPSPTEIAKSTFQVVFKGEYLTTGEEAETKARLASALNLKAKQVDVLFSGKRIIVRKGLVKKDADRFVKLFNTAGAKAYCEKQAIIENETAPANTEPTPHNDNIPADGLPTAGLVQPVTLTSIQKHTPTDTQIAPPKMPVVEPDSQVTSTTSIATPAPSPPVTGVTAKKSSKKKWLAIPIIILLLLSTATALYAPARHGAMDAWMELVHNYQPPRGITTEEINIGMSAAFSGSAKELGRSMRMGIETYFKKLNEKGGIAGRQIVLHALDDGYEPVKASKNLDTFFDKNDGVFAMIGNVGTPTASVIIPKALDDKTIVFGTFSGANLLRNDPPDRYVFNYRASYAEETAAIIHYFVRVKKIQPETIAVFYQNDGYGRDGLSGVISALDDYDVDPSIIKKGTYERNSTNIRTGVEAFIPHLENINAFIIIGTYATSAAFTKAIQKIGFDGEIANVSFVGTHALAETLVESETNIGHGILVTQTVPLYTSHASLVIDYREAMETYFPAESPDFVSLEGYITAKLFTEGLKRAGRYVNSDSLVDALESINELDLGIGSLLTFSKSDHQASHRVWGTLIKPNGDIESIDLKHHNLSDIDLKSSESEAHQD